MGEMADDLIDGVACSLCGCYFMDKAGHLYEHGYSVACNSCYEEDCGYPKQDNKVYTM